MNYFKLFLVTFALTMSICESVLTNLEVALKDLRLTGVTTIKPITIQYDDFLVNFGNELTPIQAANQPTNISWDLDPGKTYTLAMVDPDVPSKEDRSKGEVLHWLVVNIPGNNVEQGRKVATYRGPNPSTNTGLHRYISLVFEQNGLIDLEPITQLKDRFRFSIATFGQQHNLTGPLAGNFFQAQRKETNV